MTMGMINKKDGTIYADLTGKFPIILMNGMQTVFIIMYNWTTNAILVTPIKDAKAETIVECFKQNIEYLSKRGLKPVYNVMDNVATNAIKIYLESENIKVQFVTSYDHRVNVAKKRFKPSRITPSQACAFAIMNFHQYYGVK